LICAVVLMLFSVQNVLAEPVEIQWWHAQRGPREETLNKIVDAYNNPKPSSRWLRCIRGHMMKP